MKAMKKWGSLALAVLLTLSLCAAAIAEGADDSAAGTNEAAAAEDSQASEDALKEALDAYKSAGADSRKKVRPESLKQELDACVASGKLTREQADLILKYYTEQQALRKNSPVARSRGKGTRNSSGDQETQQSKSRKGKYRPQNGTKPSEAKPSDTKPAGTEPEAPGTAPDSSVQAVSGATPEVPSHAAPDRNNGT